MSIDDIVGKVQATVKGVNDYFLVPGKIESMRQYALDHYLDDEVKKQLFDGKSPEEADLIYKRLEGRIQNRVDHHHVYLDKLSLKTGKFAGLAMLLNDAYQFYKGSPFVNIYHMGEFLVGAKALLELPTMYKYVRDSGDLYGAMEWMGTKVLSFFVPVFGPALDLNVAQRVIKKKAIKEGVAQFLKEEGLYKEKDPLYKRIYDRVKEVAGDFKPAPAFQPI